MKKNYILILITLITFITSCEKNSNSGYISNTVKPNTNNQSTNYNVNKVESVQNNKESMTDITAELQKGWDNPPISKSFKQANIKVVKNNKNIRYVRISQNYPNLYRVSLYKKVSIERLVKLNNIQNVNYVLPGQKIYY